MKVIFLDIDGVLNYRTCKARCPNCKSIVGIEDSRVERLAKIVKATNTKVIGENNFKVATLETLPDVIVDIIVNSGNNNNMETTINSNPINKSEGIAWA